MSNEATEDAASDTAISFAEFLESVPPGQMRRIEDPRKCGPLRYGGMTCQCRSPSCSPRLVREHRCPFRARRLDSNSSLPGGCKQQEHRRRVEEQRNHENEPSEDCLVLGADERRQIPHRAKVDLDHAALAIHSGFLDLQVGKALASTVSLSARLLRLACRRPSSAARSLAAAASAAAWALMAAAVRGVLVLGASAALRVCDPSVPASPADCYGKRVAETENKAKKKLVSITTETST
jgi:hypothetical protein